MLSSIERVGVVGCGWLGLPLVGYLAGRAQFHVLGTTRSQEKISRITERGAKAVQLQLPVTDLRTSEMEEIFSSDALIVTLPPGRKRANTRQAYAAEINSLVDLAKQYGTKHLIYTSSTGVYGDARGRVDEQSPTQPATESAQAVLDAETTLRASGIPTTILRLAGLYGPTREPGRWFEKRPVKQADAPVNLVHQSDVITAIELVLWQGVWNEVFNVCALEHPTKGAFYRQAVQDIGLRPPKTLPGGKDGKWVDSEKIRSSLGWTSRPLR